MALKRLEAHHLIAIKYLALPRHGGKTMDEIAQECCVSRQAIYEWMKDDLFMKERIKEMKRNSMDRVPEVIDSMADAAVKDRNAAAAKLILQMNEMIVEKSEVETTLRTDVTDIADIQSKIERYKQSKNESSVK